MGARARALFEENGRGAGLELPRQARLLSRFISLFGYCYFPVAPLSTRAKMFL
jgi:hypothetical protein